MHLSLPFRSTLLVASVAGATGSASHAGAQLETGMQSEARATPRGPFFTRGDLRTLGVLGALGGAAAPFDRRIAAWSQRPGQHANRAVNHVADVMRLLGGPGVVALPVVTYGVGLAVHDRATASVGLQSGVAVVGASVVTAAVKLAAGRARPYVSHDSEPRSFAFGRGVHGDAWQSFPSGHATASFALAAALASEGRQRWPHTNHVTSPVGFAVAGLVGVSRIYHDAHWASDVLAGAGIGTAVGTAVARYAHSREHEGAQARLLPSRTMATRSPPLRLGYTLRF